MVYLYRKNVIKMYTFNENISKEEYDNFIKKTSMAPFCQEYNWSNIKQGWGHYHCGLYKDNKLVGICLILIKKMLGKTKLFYIPRGYLLDYTNYEDLNEMTKYIKKLAKKEHAYVVKIAPNFCISDDSIKGEECEHNYSEDYDIKHKNLLKAGYKWTGINKDMSKNLQPQFNMVAPMCDINSNILDVDGVLATYKSKFKYYLGDFHTKRGITFEVTNSLDKIDTFMDLIGYTERKQNISLRNKEYFLSLMENFKDRAYFVFGEIDMNKYLEFLRNNNGKEEDIEEALSIQKEKGNNVMVSTGLLLLPQNEEGIKTSEYLYAGNSPYLNNLNISQGLVFEMIKFSMSKGCHYCNLGGVDGNLNDHLSTFKRKFNARVMIFSGEYDLPTSWLYRPIKMFYPMLIKLYKLTHKKKH